MFAERPAPDPMPFDLHQIDVPFRMQPGLRRMAGDEPHLRALQADGALYREKQQVVASGKSIFCLDGFDPAETIDAIWCQAGRDAAAPADRSVPLALAFEQDLALLDLVTRRVPWMCVCVPSGWAPEDKIGLDLAAIHAPVADSAALAARWQQLMQLLASGAGWKRRVWTITPSPRHDRHPRRHTPVPWPRAEDPAVFASQCFLRSERQTFFSVPGRHGHTPRQVVFTITVALQSLPDAVRDRAGARRLKQALDSMTDAVLDYKQLAPARVPLSAWLTHQAAVLPPGPIHTE